MRKIALDAMGGDRAPDQTVAGALRAAATLDVAVLLVGEPPVLEAKLAESPEAANLPIEVIPSKGAIEEGTAPVAALRRQPESSIAVSTGLVKQGRADACVSMGSTGASMAAAAVILGMMEGLERPCLGGPVIGTAPRTIIIDVGTSVDCRPSQLLSFAIMGEVFAEQFWRMERPRIALLSVGAESGKGNRQVRETAELLEASGLNFVGNVEGNDLPMGDVEVVVCDGFTGNIVMKLTEGLGTALAGHLGRTLKDRVADDALGLIRDEVMRITNPAHTFGGGPLLGVNGVSVVGHGRADAEEIANAIGMAKLAVDVDFTGQLRSRLGSVLALAGTDREEGE